MGLEIYSVRPWHVVLAMYGESGDSFSPINSVTAVYRIARALTSRAGRALNYTPITLFITLTLFLSLHYILSHSPW